MVQIPGGFTSEGVEDMNDFSALPSGEYICKLTNAELKDTKDTSNDNKFLNLTFDVIDGDFNGRKFFVRLNMVNDNKQAVEIAQKEFATLIRACKKVSIQNTDEIMDIPIVAKLKFKPAKPTKPEDNEVMTYKQYDGTSVVNSPKKGAETAGGGEKKAAPWG